MTLWTHNAGNPGELGAINAIVADYNKSQKTYQVKVQAFPQDSYNQSVTAAAAAKKLPCILDVDAPNVPNWAWAKYLSPLTGMDEHPGEVPALAPWASGTRQTYSFGYYDVALTLISRKSVLEANGIRIPTIDKPWTAAEFNAALAKIKAAGKFKYALDLGTSATGEWWPYAYSPLLQSFGGDLINRTDYKSADGVLNGPAAVKWATWFRSMVTDGYMPLKSGADPAADFGNGVSAILWSGQWSAAPLVKKFGSDVLFLPPVDFGKGPKIGGGSWQWAVSSGCSNQAGAMDYMKFASQDKYVASVAKATFNIPATDAAAATVQGLRTGRGVRHLPAVLEEVRADPAADTRLPVHRHRVHQDRAGHPQRRRPEGVAGSGRQGHRREPAVQQQLLLSTTQSAVPGVDSPPGTAQGHRRSRPMSQSVQFKPPVAPNTTLHRRLGSGRARSQTTVGAWMVAPAAVLLVTFVLIPIALTFALAFTNAKLISPEPIRFIGFDNFSRLFSDQTFWKSLRNTIVFGVVIVPVQAGLALCLALLINVKVRGVNFFRTVYFLPVVTSMVVVSILWTFMYQPNGLINSLLAKVGIHGPDWLGQHPHRAGRADLHVDLAGRRLPHGHLAVRPADHLTVSCTRRPRWTGRRRGRTSGS